MALAMSAEEKIARIEAVWEIAKNIEEWMREKGIVEVNIDGVILKRTNAVLTEGVND